MNNTAKLGKAPAKKHPEKTYSKIEVSGFTLQEVLAIDRSLCRSIDLHDIQLTSMFSRGNTLLLNQLQRVC